MTGHEPEGAPATVITIDGGGVGLEKVDDPLQVAECVARLLELLEAEEDGDPTAKLPHHAIVSAFAAVAQTTGINELQLVVTPRGFELLRADLTLEEREEQSRRWGGAELRFRTRLGWTRVVVRDVV